MVYMFATHPAFVDSLTGSKVDLFNRTKIVRGQGAWTFRVNLVLTIFTISIQTLQLLNTIVLKFEQVQFTTRCCVKNCWMSDKQCRPWWDAAFAASHLGLHCLLRHVRSNTQHYLDVHRLIRPVCPNTYCKYGHHNHNQIFDYDDHPRQFWYDIRKYFCEKK